MDELIAQIEAAAALYYAVPPAERDSALRGTIRLALRQACDLGFRQGYALGSIDEGTTQLAARKALLDAVVSDHAAESGYAQQAIQDSASRLELLRAWTLRRRDTERAYDRFTSADAFDEVLQEILILTSGHFTPEAVAAATGNAVDPG